MSDGRIWLLAGPRAGELAQQRRLAAALAQSWEEKPVFEPGQAARAAFGWTPEKAEQSGLVAPWPALVISFGKTLQAALWIKRASGGRTRIIHLGRSRDIAPAQLDLLLPLPQDSVPAAANVFALRLPLNAPPQLDEPARAAALQRLAALPRPWTCLIVGGLSRHFTLDSARVEALAVQLAKQGRGGSLLVCTSPRTPPAWAAALKQALGQAGVAHEISDYADGRSREAYAEYLALADRLVVTGDSASMIADALRSGRPLQVVPLRPSLHLRRRRLLRGLFPAPLERALIRRGIWAPTVDLDRWIAALARDGLIGIFGRSEARLSWNAALDDDLSRLAQRVAPWLA
ncbi:ELM1/GtrOC1 family putative glycosyltransferase [Hydrocarboniphaga sp.]|uniref:ELM1/GtrOC1 family putative glycosyltransferase n=1 Tax=Hydrocarboniphaga sp. TaxID=2033016 RepID=UPI003D0D468A